MKTYNVKYLKKWEDCERSNILPDTVFGITLDKWGSDTRGLIYSSKHFRFPHNLIVRFFGRNFLFRGVVEGVK